MKPATKMRRPTFSLPVAIWARTKRNVGEYLPRLARVGALLTVLFGGLFLFVGHRAKADIHEVMLGFGAQMMRYDGAERQGAPRQIYMNGERMMLATAATTHSLDDVLGYYERRCMARDGNLEQELLRQSGANLAGAPAVDERLVDATIRHETGGRGYVACIDMGEGAISIPELTERVTAFADTGNLAEVGHLRYVYVTDEITKRHIVTFWTEGSFNIGKIVPSTGDAPGRDVDALPRPAGSRRLLSAWEDGQPQSLTVYAFAPQGRDALESFYRTELPRQGWSISVPRQESARTGRRPAELDDIHLIGAEREGRSAFLVVGEDADGHGTLTVLTAR